MDSTAPVVLSAQSVSVLRLACEAVGECHMRVACEAVGECHMRVACEAVGECHVNVGQLLFDHAACQLLWHVHGLVSVPGPRARVCAWRVEWVTLPHQLVYNIQLEWYNMTWWRRHSAASTDTALQITELESKKTISVTSCQQLLATTSLG
jgi:hypothetical protein